MSQQKPGKPQQPANQKDEDAVAFAQGIFELASKHGHPETVRLLLEKGADREAKDSNGNTALSLAKTDSVKRLFEESGR
ncbi:MAG: ankyrin repeat domain-containing protein [Marinobacter sp.]|nr:ankyrin repeat domain-containing protein [Marinobacter sp.]